MVAFFDTAFTLRDANQDSPVLLYALGLLFSIPCPDDAVARVAQSGVTQAVLSEPGTAQKAFSLLGYWHLNGLKLDRQTLGHTINQMVLRHKASGVTSDVSWALAFCIEQDLALSPDAGRVLCECDDDCILIQSLHCHQLGLLPSGFSKGKVGAFLKQIDMDGEHWLLGYEAVRHGFARETAAVVAANSLFSDLLRQSVTFYRLRLPPFGNVVHQGSAPDWVVSSWLEFIAGRRPATRPEWSFDRLPILRSINEALTRLPKAAARSTEDTIHDLLSAFEALGLPPTLEDGHEMYG